MIRPATRYRSPVRSRLISGTSATPRRTAIMKSVIDIRRSAVPVVLAALSLLTTACTLGKQSPPSPSGPSEFALSVAMTASPDQLPRDGSSQSVVTLTALDASGKPVVGQRFTLTGNGAPVTMSQTQVTTG